MVENKYLTRNVLVLGLGVSGIAALKFLQGDGRKIYAANSSQVDDKTLTIVKSLSDEVFINPSTEDIGKLDFDLLVKSPGIPYENDIVKLAVNRGIEIITEPELSLPSFEGKLIGVTGTNGKTTVTTLIKDFLQTEYPNKKVLAAGNIGFPVSDAVAMTSTKDIIVTELSSFQLMGMPSVKPHTAVINNIFSAHLDFHHSQENYEQAKLSITKKQTGSDYLIADLPKHIELVTSAQKFLKSSSSFENISITEEGLFVDGQFVMAKNEIRLVGNHNYHNIIMAIKAAKTIGLKNSTIKKVLSEFNGVKHRMQFLGEMNMIRVFNDSKSTNIEAAKVALDSFEKPKLVWIAGGLDRNEDYSSLRNHINGLKALITYGQTSGKMVELGNSANVADITQVDTLEDAVQKAFSIAKPGDTILFSPGAASWDQYKNFEIRGDKFIEAVNNFSGEKI